MIQYECSSHGAITIASQGWTLINSRFYGNQLSNLKGCGYRAWRKWQLVKAIDQLPPAWSRSQSSDGEILEFILCTSINISRLLSIIMIRNRDSYVLSFLWSQKLEQSEVLAPLSPFSSHSLDHFAASHIYLIYRSTCIFHLTQAASALEQKRVGALCTLFSLSVTLLVQYTHHPYSCQDHTYSTFIQTLLDCSHFLTSLHQSLA